MEAVVMYFRTNAIEESITELLFACVVAESMVSSSACRADPVAVRGLAAVLARARPGRHSWSLNANHCETMSS
jgi:hypothetical protein